MDPGTFGSNTITLTALKRFPRETNKMIGNVTAFPCFFQGWNMAESKLPGRPKVRLVREVKGFLRLYFESRPTEWNATWRSTWAWANECRLKTPTYGAKSPPWPSPSEIACQFVVLSLAKMRDSIGLRLPYNAAQSAPELVRAFVPMMNATGRIENKGGADATSSD